MKKVNWDNKQIDDLAWKNMDFWIPSHRCTFETGVCNSDQEEELQE